MPLKLMFITNSPQTALIAEKYGVERIWIDLETMGKEERQKGLNSVKSHHKVEDIKTIAPLLTKSELLVRVNPWNDNSDREIDRVVRAGAEVIMLPMWKTLEEVKNFIQVVKGRAKVSLLLETREAESCLNQVLDLPEIHEVYIGLNDLHLSYGLKFMFELLSNGIVERICKKIAAKGIPYGFGGIAGIGQGLLPAEKIVAEHYRLGSTRVILSRSFCNTDDAFKAEKIFSTGIRALRRYEETLKNWPAEAFTENKNHIDDIVKRIVGDNE